MRQFFLPPLMLGLFIAGGVMFLAVTVYLAFRLLVAWASVD